MEKIVDSFGLLHEIYEACVSKVHLDPSNFTCYVINLEDILEVMDVTLGGYSNRVRVHVICFNPKALDAPPLRSSNECSD